MVEMSCEEHDEAAASTQFITHTVGRMLATMELKSTRINTKGFDALLNLVNQTNSDSFELYYGLFLYNQNATDELERLEQVIQHHPERAAKPRGLPSPPHMAGGPRTTIPLQPFL